MPGSTQFEALLTTASGIPLAEFATLFDEERSIGERVAAVEEALRQSGQGARDEIGQWIAGLLGVEELVPELYKSWRRLVRECMVFFASHFPAARLARKIVAQMDLPPETPGEVRLGMLIARTPGLQKIGQVLARNRRLSAPLRQELQKLENGIHDVTVAEIREIVVSQLKTNLETYQVELALTLRAEASVSAILDFTWLNPASGCRERGVFKVMKPYIRACYAEDLLLLQGLAEHLLSAGTDHKSAFREAADTMNEVRFLLEREVDFRREQATLAEVGRIYKRTGVHAPTPVPQLSTQDITAMSLEQGVKVTEAFHRQPRWGRRVAIRTVEALIADPILSGEEDAVFHADPHAGNLLYDEANDELIVLDWALTGRLTRAERRQIARLIVMMTFRDAAGVGAAIRALSSESNGSLESDAAIIDGCVDRFFGEMPFVCSPGAIDAMRLLDRIGMEGVRFPASLVLIRKVLFTLDGVLRDIAGQDVRLDTIVTREFALRWLGHGGVPPGPFQFSDLLAMERSALLYVTGLWSWFT